MNKNIIQIYLFVFILLLKQHIVILKDEERTYSYSIKKKDTKAIGNVNNKLKNINIHKLDNINKKDLLGSYNENYILIKLKKQDIFSKKLSTYYGQVQIGEQSENNLNVIFDTGSSEVWILNDTCKNSLCNNMHSKYKRTKSFAYKYDKKGLPSVIEIFYLSGKIVAFEGYDTLYLGKKLKIPHTNISFATKVNIPVLEEFKWDGIIGLGFENGDSIKRGIKPFLDVLKDDKILTNKNYKNQFGYYLSDKEGYITLGGIDNRLKNAPDEKIIWTPVSTEMGYWTIQILGIRKEYVSNHFKENKEEDEVIVKYEAFHDGGKNSIIDTGTYLIYAPKNTMENYLKDLKINNCDEKYNLPHLIFQIKADKIKTIKGLAIIEIVLTPNDYVIEYVDKKNNTKECILGIQPDEQSEEDNIDGWTLGQVFLKAYYTIFDKENLKIGFVRSKRNVSLK
ncbi:plasmepsin VII [Plasmodium sp. DRC-Itaito]|nr:plasmepsin VII [Plasmodium sp. DRC-Itaito]